MKTLALDLTGVRWDCGVLGAVRGENTESEEQGGDGAGMESTEPRQHRAAPSCGHNTPRPRPADCTRRDQEKNNLALAPSIPRASLNPGRGPLDRRSSGGRQVPVMAAFARLLSVFSPRASRLNRRCRAATLDTACTPSGDVMVEGLVSLDRRSVAARALLDWRAELMAALGGEETVTPQQTALERCEGSRRWLRDPRHGLTVDHPLA